MAYKLLTCQRCGRQYDYYSIHNDAAGNWRNSYCSPKCHDEAYGKMPPVIVVNKGPDLVDEAVDFLFKPKERKPTRKEISEARTNEVMERLQNAINDPDYEKKKAEWAAENERHIYSKTIPWTVEAYLANIDEQYEEAVPKITAEFKKYAKQYSTNNEEAFRKTLDDLDEYRTKCKMQLTSDFVKNNTRETIKNVLKIKNARIDFWRKCNSLEYEAFKKAQPSNGLSKLFIALAIIAALGGIILGIRQHNFVLPVLGIITGFVCVILAWNNMSGHGTSKWGGDFQAMVLGFLGCPCMLVISIILGAGLHSFLFGLIGVITSIVLFFVFLSRIDK